MSAVLFVFFKHSLLSWGGFSCQLSPCVPCEQKTDAAPSAQVLDCSWTRFHPHPSLMSTPTPSHTYRAFCGLHSPWRKPESFPLFFHSIQVKIHLQPDQRCSTPGALESPVLQGSLSDSSWAARAPEEHTTKGHMDGQKHSTCSLLHLLCTVSDVTKILLDNPDLKDS